MDTCWKKWFLLIYFTQERERECAATKNGAFKTIQLNTEALRKWHLKEVLKTLLGAKAAEKIPLQHHRLHYTGLLQGCATKP